MARIAAGEGFDVEPRRQFVPQFLPAAEFRPRHDFRNRHAEGHGGEEIESRRFSDPVIFRAVIHIGAAVGDGVETFKGADKFARCKHPHSDGAARHFGDEPGRALRGFAEAGKVLRPRRHHFQLARAQRSRNDAAAGRRAAFASAKQARSSKRAAREQLSAFHHETFPFPPARCFILLRVFRGRVFGPLLVSLRFPPFVLGFAFGAAARFAGGAVDCAG